MALWSHLIEMRNSWQNSHEPDRRDIYRREYVDVLKSILPYERPRLQVVKVKTDSDQVREPEEMAKALAKALTPDSRFRALQITGDLARAADGRRA
jgi:hypothetical protein